jgi:hypothetical protein
MLTSVADADAGSITLRVLSSALLESGEVGITVARGPAAELEGSEAALAAMQLGEAGSSGAAPAGPDGQQGQQGLQGEGEGRAAGGPLRCTVRYRAVMRLRMLPPLQAWRNKVFQMQCDEVAAMLANVAAVLAEGRQPEG